MYLKIVYDTHEMYSEPFEQPHKNAGSNIQYENLIFLSAERKRIKLYSWMSRRQLVCSIDFSHYISRYFTKKIVFIILLGFTVLAMRCLELFFDF